MAVFRKLLKNRAGDTIIPVTDVISNYSDEEVNTGCTWRDGKQIYKKTIDCGAMPNASNKTVTHGISNLSKIIKLEGYTSNGSYMLPLPYVAAPSYAAIAVLAGTTNILIRTSWNAGSEGYTESYITLYYTKTS